MLVKDVMTKNPVTVDGKVSVLEAKEIMSKKNINKLPVVNKAGAVVGIVTSNDLQRAAPSDATTLDMFELGYLLSKLTVEKIMVKKVVTVSQEETVEEAARIMADKDFGCLPVMDGKKLVGIITDSDLFRLFIEMFNTRVPGVRVSVTLNDIPGALSVFAQKVADEKGQIISCVTTSAPDSIHRKICMKATGITLAKMKTIAESCGKVEDIRKI